MNGSDIALEVRNLVRRYGGLIAVDNLSLEVKRGEIFGFPWAQWCRKNHGHSDDVWTPEAHIWGGVYSWEQGGNGKRRRISAPWWGYVPRKTSYGANSPVLSSWSSVRGCTMCRSKWQDPEPISCYFKWDWSRKRHKLAGTLSGGMKRRMNVILAMMHDPDIMVFDEPEAGLDPQSRVVVREFIRESSKNKTVIVTTHNMDEAERIADRVAIIDSGRLLQLDTPHNLKRSIGQGDILELKLSFQSESNLERAESKLNQHGFTVARNDDICTIRAMDLVPRIHEIYKVLENEQVTIGEMRVRENTLEDVFIHLTGKSLRL